MNKFLFVVVVITFTSCDSIKKLYVKFGAVKPQLESRKDEVIRLFFDRKGTLYPDTLITDEEMYSSGSSLNQLYKNRRTVFNRVLGKYNLSSASGTAVLQQKIIDEIAAKINRQSAGRQLVFLIHGYNKHPLKPADDSGMEGYRLLRETIRNRYPGKQLQFVEVYWDGCSKMNGKKAGISKNLNSIKVWKHAQPASNNVAIELRRLLNKVENDRNIIITHSLGASVITCALFNVQKFKMRKFMTSILAKYQDAVHYQTPLKYFKIGMLAPAIPGINTFDEFADRTPSGVGIYNYSFIVGFNGNDQVLGKYIGKPKWFGATTLGRLQEEVDSVVKMVNTSEHTVMRQADFSLLANNDRQTDHSFLVYIRNSKPMNEFLDYLFR